MSEHPKGDRVEQRDGAWRSDPHPEPPCGCVPTQTNHDCVCTSSCTADCTCDTSRCTEQCTVDTIRLVGAAGGSGTSTIAAVLALHAATMVSTELVAANAEHTSALLGVGPPDADARQVLGGLTLTTDVVEHAGITVIDEGTLDRTTDASVVRGGVRRIGVLRGPCYLALRTLMAGPHGLDGLIVVAEAGRALNERDVSDVTGLDVYATVAATPTIARTIDAGLLARRYRNLAEFRTIRRWLTLHLDPFPTPRPGTRTTAPNHPSMSGTDLPLPPNGVRSSQPGSHLGARPRRHSCKCMGALTSRSSPDRTSVVARVEALAS